MLQDRIPENIFIINNDMWWSKDDIGAYDYLVRTNSEFIPTILPYLTTTSVAVQAGGHCGWMIRELEKVFKTIYTFEPDPVEFLCLTLNCNSSNIHKLQACVGNEHKLVNLFRHEGQSGANYVSGQGQIPMFLIDDLALQECSFIQLDLEGFEYFGLLGAEQTILKHKPLICIERYWNTRFGVSAQTIDQFFDKINYSLVARLGESDHIYKARA